MVSMHNVFRLPDEVSPGEEDQAVQESQAGEVCPLPDEGRPGVQTVHVRKQGV